MSFNCLIMIQTVLTIDLNISSLLLLSYQNSAFSDARQDIHVPRTNCMGQIHFAPPGQAEIEVQWPGGQVKIASVVL